jgi:hypothetical protein
VDNDRRVVSESCPVLSRGGHEECAMVVGIPCEEMSVTLPKRGAHVNCIQTTRMEKVSGNFTTTGRILFYNIRKKILENCRCIVPNFIND